CQMAPFVKKHHFHPRATDDLFVMVIECTSKTNETEVESFLAATGAIEINVQNAETGWWLGRYDKDKKPFEQKNTAIA
ncbi:MAG: quinol:electron acceptor oxidoreductase subunit ActD, partial [Bacteroidota bacterium]